MQNHNHEMLILVAGGTWGASESTHSFVSLCLDPQLGVACVNRLARAPGDPLDAGFHPPLRGEDGAGRAPAQG